MKASKMKENLINDKEQAYLSKTLMTIDTNAPIEIGLTVTYSGPHLENLAKFLWETGFVPSGLGSQWRRSYSVAIDYTEVEQVTSDMLTEDSFFHFEILGTITISEPIIEPLHGTKGQFTIYRYLPLQILDFQRISRKRPHTYDFQAAKVCFSHLGIPQKSRVWQSIGQVSLVDRRGIMWNFNHCESLGQIALLLDEVVAAREPKSYPRKRRSY